MASPKRFNVALTRAKVRGWLVPTSLTGHHGTGLVAADADAADCGTLPECSMSECVWELFHLDMHSHTDPLLSSSTSCHQAAGAAFELRSHTVAVSL